MLKIEKRDKDYMILSHICSLYTPSVESRGLIINIILPYSQYHMVLDSKGAYVVNGIDIQSNCEFEGSLDILVDILKGKRDPYITYLNGDFYISGERSEFFALINSFNFHYNPLSKKNSGRHKIKRGPFGLKRDFSYLLYTSISLMIWLGWIYNFNSTLTFGITLIILILLTIYYKVTDTINSFEIFLLTYTGLSFLMFLFKNSYYISYYNIFLIVALPVFFTGSLYSRRRNLLSQYNSHSINGVEDISEDIFTRQRQGIVLWTLVWGLLIATLYIYNYTDLSHLVSQLFLSIISIIFGGVILSTIYTIHPYEL